MEIETLSRAVRGDWTIESSHWHLDAAFKEDTNGAMTNSRTERQYHPKIVSEYDRNDRVINKKQGVVNELE